MVTCTEEVCTFGPNQGRWRSWATKRPDMALKCHITRDHYGAGAKPPPEAVRRAWGDRFSLMGPTKADTLGVPG